MRFRLPGTRPARQAPEPADVAARAAGVHAGYTSRTPAPTPGRGARLHAGVRVLAIGSAELLLIVGALIVVGWVVGKLWIVLLPIVIGLLISTVLWPLVRFLRDHRWPPALAALTAVLLFLGALGGIGALIATPVADQATELADQATEGLEELQGLLAGPPFNLGEDQVGQWIDQGIDTLQNNAQDVAGYALTGATTIGNFLLTLLLALLLTFFFLKDGPRWVPWLAAQTGAKAAPHVAALSLKTWQTLAEFIRQQALVGFVDAFFIGLGLFLLDVPLVLPLAVLTFFGAFIPIIGAFVAGGFAVLIALVSNGVTTALLVLLVVVLVQQVEGNVLQPFLQGRGLNLHAAVVILAVTAGGSLAGITGAFLAVPVAALIAVIYRYVRDELDQKSPETDEDGTRARLTGDEHGVALTREPVERPSQDGAGDRRADAPDDGPATARAAGEGPGAAGTDR